ncbi:MAG: 4-(cytidine 5'-diphospho)-2-C-methyl-D-erythritol kinase [Treponema sp.]|jgi:4-diphosphocytidyl-2-C-methyl-D-erythritol kinase|nr:4-(cytidine 5'-diphospho)-2-C-methyl-D-erythritol kinase [Treponema sp.]
MYIEAPCKVNLHLKVLGKRSDGFHNLESVFALLAFGDSLEVSVLSGKSGLTSLTMAPKGRTGLLWNEEIASLSPEKNLVYKAASLFREQTGFDGDFSVTIKKSVPPGSGLGGGSSDAAAALFAFNSIAGKPLSTERLLAAAARLGSDVPFFLSGETTAWVSGRGEVLQPLSPLFSGYGVLLVFPGFQSGTAEAYDFLDKNREKAADESPSPAKDEIIAALDKSPALWPFTNDFLSVFLKTGGDRGERYASILDSLEDSGALFRGLSGSGSACFGIYRTKEDAERAKINFEKKYCVQNTNFLALRPFRH